ncbi:hypothetical protein GCM10009789_38530 [Kribbella sancticallisti]|uniref:Aspartate carbamoyltransferase n=1 Tax=Kribbella sancticallisti TaxID=460087 RepID=A0ABN2DQ36_9ACTN
MTDPKLSPLSRGVRRKPWPLVVMVALVAVAATGWWLATRGGDLADRRAEVAARGADVMPFDLTRTTHVFSKNATGGVQTVTANDPADTTQIELIRGHLREEATKFTRGDFADPAAIHGHDMPGLAELRAGAARVDVRYEQLEDGATLSYSTEEPQLVKGIHAWFEAQSSDHG